MKAVLKLGAFAVFAMALFTSCEQEESLPNVILILTDDMGYGDVGSYNPESKIATPNIDKLASEGMSFRDAHAAGSLCHPSRYGLMTGVFPFRTDVRVWPKHALIKEGQMTVASMLKQKNYHTAMVGKWHNGFEEIGYENVMEGGPVDRGFDSFFGMRASTDIPPYFYIRDDRAVLQPSDSIGASSTEGWSPIQGAFWREGGIAPEFSLDRVLPDFTQEAITVMEKHVKEAADRPLFLYLAYPAPHTPWLPDEEFAGTSKADLYGDFVEMVDAHVGKVMHALEENGLAENSIVIFSSDNGPVWYDEDVERLGHDAAGVLRGMKGDAWEAGHRMPFIVRWPGEVVAASESSALISFVDVLSTLSEIAGVAIDGHAQDSYSFLAALKGEEHVRPPIIHKAAGWSSTIRSGKWKLMNHLGSGGFSKPNRVEAKEGGPAGQLYNLEVDISEQRNLYLEHPELVDSLTIELEKIMGEQ